MSRIDAELTAFLECVLGGGNVTCREAEPPEPGEYLCRPGWHRHKCPTCGFVWEHPAYCAGDRKAHMCVCGTEVWRRHHGSCAPAYSGDKRPRITTVVD